jgi:hypothetical protein
VEEEVEMSIAALKERLFEGGEGEYEKYIFGNIPFVIMDLENGESGEMYAV